MFTTFEIDVRAPVLGRFWTAVSPKIRPLPKEGTDLAIQIGDSLYQLSGPRSFDYLREFTRGRRVLVVVHGYNSKEENVRQAYCELFRQLTQREFVGLFYDVVMFVYWPGGWAPGYTVARWRTGGVGGQLAKSFLALDQAKSVDVQTHSMGARVLAETLKANGKVQVRNWIAAAAAIQNDDLSEGGGYAALLGQITGTVLAPYSELDGVLKRDFPIAELDKALGYSGPQKGLKIDPKVRAVDARGCGSGHSVFRTCDLFFDLWSSIL